MGEPKAQQFELFIAHFKQLRTVFESLEVAQPLFNTYISV